MAACLIVGLIACNSVSAQFRYHTPPKSAHPLMQRQHEFDLPSLLVTDSGQPVTSKEQWFESRRPELIAHWRRILGKLRPAPEDARWFGDITKSVEINREQKDGYTRIELQIPIETDFLQPHVLLIPDNAEPGQCPAVIAWTSTGPDYRQPEEWWGRWLAQHGCVVLTGWAHIRNYRNGISYRNGVNKAVYDRFGHWLPMAKMVDDVQREVEYLKAAVPAVDPERIGFMGFSLSAKSALYVAAFSDDIKATVSIDPHLAMHGDTNYHDEWYLDWRHRFDDIQTPGYPDAELRGTVFSLLDADPARPGFERNHHELLALAAPRAMMVIGCSTDQDTAVHSDDRQSIAYVNRAREVYDLLGISDRLQYAPLTCGHKADHPDVTAAWQPFLRRWLEF
ncbi:MAG: acyl-CoA thioester hydrolase/BAAT C-terminal domain-containing protein [Planctomycetaceae bacterium]